MHVYDSKLFPNSLIGIQPITMAYEQNLCREKILKTFFQKNFWDTTCSFSFRQQPYVFYEFFFAEKPIKIFISDKFVY